MRETQEEQSKNKERGMKKGKQSQRTKKAKEERSTRKNSTSKQKKHWRAHCPKFSKMTADSNTAKKRRKQEQELNLREAKSLAFLHPFCFITNDCQSHFEKTLILLSIRVFFCLIVPSSCTFFVLLLLFFQLALLLYFYFKFLLSTLTSNQSFGNPHSFDSSTSSGSSDSPAVSLFSSVFFID